MEHLLSQYVDVVQWARATAPVTDVEAAGMDLLRRWNEPHRGYHDVRHLTDVLRRLDVLAVGNAAVGAPSHLAAWYHDAVYEGVPEQDERRSAALAYDALTALGVPEPTAARVRDLVMVTATHQPPPDDPGAAALVDADLAVLAAAPEDYAAYVAGVRTEYRHLDEGTFRTGRADLLRRLLARDPLFTTAGGRVRWEAAARDNLRRELDGLSGPG